MLSLYFGILSIFFLTGGNYLVLLSKVTIAVTLRMGGSFAAFDLYGVIKMFSCVLCPVRYFTD